MNNVNLLESRCKGNANCRERIAKDSVLIVKNIIW